MRLLAVALLILLTGCKAAPPVEIESVDPKGDRVVVKVRQNGMLFVVHGLNRKTFTVNGRGRLPLLDRHFVRFLDVLDSVREPASLKDQLCRGQVWKDMTTEQFRFLAGDPESRRPLSHQAGRFGVWAFAGRPGAQPRYYCFLGEKLYSWTR